MNRKACLLLLTLIVGLCITFVPGVPTAHAAAGSSILHPGETLSPGQSLTSGNGYALTVQQSDGNLVLYSEYNGHHWTWQANTENKGAARVTMQGDGNLVVYSDRGTPLWTSGTDGHNGAYLVVQTDGNAVVYNADGTWSGWATNTSVQSSHTAVSGCKPVTVSQDFHKGSFHLVTANVAFTYCYNGSSAWLAGGVHCWLSDIRDRATVSNITWCGTHEQNFTIGQNFTILIFVPSLDPVPAIVTFNGWLRAAPYGNGDMNTDWGGTITNIS